MKLDLDITLTEYDTLVRALYAYDECVRNACAMHVTSTTFASEMRNSIMTVRDKIFDAHYDSLKEGDY